MKTKTIRYVLEEIRRVRSYADLKHLAGKVRYRLNQKQYRKHGETGLPLCLQIEPTNRCNINCICCSRSSCTRPSGYMDMRLFSRIIDDAAQSNVRRIHLYLHGEPFLHPEVVQMIRYMKSKDLGINIATNGMLLDRETGRAVLNAGMNSADHITFSMLGLSREVHEAVMRGVNHDRVAQNITDFLEERKKLKNTGPVVETLMYLMPENAGERDAFIAHWRGIVDHVRDVGGISTQFAPGGDRSRIQVRTDTCLNLWERMTVYWNGDVTTCIADLNGDSVVGNLRDQSISKVWQSPALMRIREFHRNGMFDQLNLCSKCDW